MANTKHKSVDARKTRNARHKRPIVMLRELFNCTSAQTVGHIQRVQNLVRENTDLKAQVQQLKEENSALRKQIAGIMESDKEEDNAQ